MDLSKVTKTFLDTSKVISLLKDFPYRFNQNKP